MADQGFFSADLVSALEQARTLGFLGPGLVDVHIRHSLAFGALLSELGASESHSPVLDMGSGGGVPGLVLAALWPDARLVLLDSNHRRSQFLEEVIDGWGWHARVAVVEDRAESAAGTTRFRSQMGVVVARGFGPPGVTAECAAPLLRSGGYLVVSEPPATLSGRNRWPRAGLEQLGLVPVRREVEPFAFQVMRQERECPAAFPRRVGMAVKRPLF